MCSKSVIILLLHILIVLISNVSCCEQTFNQIPIYFAQNSDGDKFELKNFTGCVNDGEVFKEIELIRVHNTPPIPILYKNSVANLPKLKILFFKFNNITELEPGCFNNLTDLNFLVVVNNSLTEIKSFTFSDLPVQLLFLSDNQIKKIDLKAFSNMPNLDTLYLNNNKLQYFYRQWFHNTNKLRSLILTNNHLFSLPSQAFANTQLIQLLGFSRNNLKSIHPTAFKGLEVLKELDLSKNQLEELPPTVFSSIQSCEYVYLNNNNLTYIHQRHLKDLQFLTEFTVHSNPMQCSCLFKIEKWAGDNSISLNGFNKNCMLPENPVCVNLKSKERMCMESVHKELNEYYYKHFVHPNINCDDDPIEL